MAKADATGMKELSIKLRIAEKEYPMRVREDEEERVRLAGKLLNERLKNFREQFGVEDKQDLLAMVAFDLMADRLLQNESNAESQSVLGEKLQQLDDLLTASLQS